MGKESALQVSISFLPYRNKYKCLRVNKSLDPAHRRHLNLYHLFLSFQNDDEDLRMAARAHAGYMRTYYLQHRAQEKYVCLPSAHSIRKWSYAKP